MTPDLLRNLAAFTLQAALVTIVIALLLQVLRIASAGTRYLCWRVGLVVCLVMPLVLQRPADHPVALWADDPTSTLSVAGSFGEIPSAAEAEPAPAAPLNIPWGFVVVLVIGVGAAGRAAWLTIGLIRLRALHRRGRDIADQEYDHIQATLGTRAMLKSVDGLTQPATFGLWRPVVLLPVTLAAESSDLRRAVVTHELFHVQRRDWLSVLVEECIRTLLWFHLPVVWLTTRIQLAREEVVDELTILATGNRKAYIEALMTFADIGTVRPAPAFARRRHLFTRIVRLSKEGVMSSPRIVISAGVVIGAILGAGWYASYAFPIVSAAVAPTESAPIPTAVAPPEQRPSSVQSDPMEQDSSLREVQAKLRVLSERTEAAAAAQGARSGGAPRPGPASVAAPPTGTKPITPENPIPRRVFSVPVPYPAQLRGTGLRATAVFRITVDASGSVADVQRVTLEATGNLTSEAMGAFLTTATDAIRQWRYQSPADPPIAFFVRIRFDNEADAVATQSDGSAELGGRAGLVVTTDYIREQLGDVERRLAALRAERSDSAARFGERWPRVVELDQQIQSMERELERARELRQRAEAGSLTATAVVSAAARNGGPGVADRPQLFSPSGATPVRVGGNVKPPQKTRHVDPIYPEIAKAANVQGVVILETLIDEQGRVADARILRSIPLLDQAALDAVRQWEFTPTLLNGVPVPILMTVTVQFSLSEPQPVF